MKILIISPSRTGGRILNIWLCAELNYLFVHEPFHFHKESFIKNDNQLIETLNNSNIVMKVNFGDWRKMFSDYNFLSFFDKVICLTRENVYDAAISYTKALETNNFTKGYHIDDSWIESNKDEIDGNYVYLKSQMEMTREIKNSLQITYEGLYETGEDIDKVKNYLNIFKLNHTYFLNKNLKYRNHLKLI